MQTSTKQDGLFVKNYLGTVSTVPRARPLSVRRSRSMDRNGPACADTSPRPIRTSGGEDFSDRFPLAPNVQYPPPVRRVAADPAEAKKKEKKWSLGGFFRRRKKGADSESSSPEDEDPAPRKGFLARRRSRREKRKQKSKIVGTFDHVVVNPLSQPPLKSNRTPDVNGTSTSPRGDLLTDVRGTGRGSRDSLGGSIDRLSSRSSRESLPQQQHRRQDSSLSRNSSGGSGSLEGSCRRGKRDMVKARVEAMRDQQRAESSSDECDGLPNSPSLARFRSDDSLIPMQREGSFSKRSRLARTERYIKRLSRDEEGILKKEAEMDPQQRQRLCKSDAEGSFNKVPLNKNVNKGVMNNNNRWAATVLYQESSDIEPRYLTRTPSATPSPAQSPLVRHKHVLHYTSSTPPIDPLTSTFPPSHYHGPIMSKSPPQNSSVRMPAVARTYSAHGLSPAPTNRINDSLIAHGLPRSRMDYVPSRQNLNYENVYSKPTPNPNFEFQPPGQRSHSYDSNIHHVSTFATNLSGPCTVTGADDVMVVQFPIVRPQSLQPRNIETSIGRGSSASPSLFKQGPPPPPPRDPQRRLTTTSGQQDMQRPMSYAFENGSQQTSRLEYSLLHGSQPMDRNANIKTFSFVPQPHIITNIPSIGSAWVGYQRRSSSDNQISAQLALQNQPVKVQSCTPRPRPSSVTSEVVRPLPQQYNQNRLVSRTTPDFINPNKQPPPNNQQFQYFADQQPRSRKPIHIQYSNNAVNDQPYLSDSQVVMMKPPYQDRRNPVLNATEFWRQKEQEGVVRHRKPIPSKPPLQHSTRSDRSRSNSPRPKEHVIPDNFRVRPSKLRIPPMAFPVRPTDSMSSLSGQSDISSPMQPPKLFSDGSYYDSCESSGGGTHASDSLKKKDSGGMRPLSMVLENTESQEQMSSSPINEEVAETFANVLEAASATKPTPPVPPMRRYSRQSSTSSLETNEWMGDDPTSENNTKKKRRSSNLEDALNELEAIYKSLRLGDEDLLDRAERRDLPTAHQQQREGFSQGLSSWYIPRGAESDSGFNYGYGSSCDSTFDLDPPFRRQRAPSMRRSGIPDKVTDDMAYRRLHPKERPGSQDIRNVVSQSGSYILASPALSQSPDSAQHKQECFVNEEPDVTFDDVVYRSIRHANNTLKIVEPQPPFGIPLGPIAPAANSDYLHATPVERYRPTFKPRKIPDVVKDDLAFRNLRKDPQRDYSVLSSITGDDVGALLSTTRTENSNFSLRKKRAVRSLSANLTNLVHKEPLSVVVDKKEQDFEKAQSLTDLPDALQVAQKILEGKEVIGGGSVKLRNLPSTSVELSKHHNKPETTAESMQLDPRYGNTPASWVERATLDRNSLCTGISTSTETLTDSRANLQQDGINKRSSWQQRLRVYIPSSGDAGSGAQRQSAPVTPERNSSQNKPPIFSSPLSTSQVDTCTVDEPVSPIDDSQLEDLLSTLAREARATSEKLDLELQQLVESSSRLRALPLQQSQSQTAQPAHIDNNMDSVQKDEVNMQQSGIVDQTQTLHMNNRDQNSHVEKHKSVLDVNLNISVVTKQNTVNPNQNHVEESNQESTGNEKHNITMYSNLKDEVVNPTSLTEEMLGEKQITGAASQTHPKESTNTISDSKQSAKLEVEIETEIISDPPDELPLKQWKIDKEIVKPMKIPEISNMKESVSVLNTSVVDHVENVSNLTLEQCAKQSDETDAIQKVQSLLIVADAPTQEDNFTLKKGILEDITKLHEEVCVSSVQKEIKEDIDSVQKEVCQESASVQSERARASSQDDITVEKAESSLQQRASSEGHSWGQDDELERGAVPCVTEQQHLQDESEEERERDPEAEPSDSSMSDRRLALSRDATSGSSDGAGAESRMARYKEERRRQLATQFGSRDRETEPAPQKRYITRSSATSSLRGSEGGGSSSNTEQTPSSGAMRVRTTRTSRLRAAVISTDPGPASQKDSALSSRSSTSATAGKDSAPVSSRTRRAGLTTDVVERRVTTSTGTGSSDKEKSPLSLDSGIASSPRREKDKSSKRKSNLNRSLAAEDVVTDPSEDSAVRRRRRRLEQTNGTGLLGFQPLSATEQRAASRQSPRISPRVSPDPFGLLSSPRKSYGILDSSSRISPRSTPDPSGLVAFTRKSSVTAPASESFNRISSRTTSDPAGITLSTRKSSVTTVASGSPRKISPRTTPDPISTVLPPRKCSTHALVSNSSHGISPRTTPDHVGVLPTRKTSTGILSSDTSIRISPRTTGDLRRGSDTACRISPRSAIDASHVPSSRRGTADSPVTNLEQVSSSRVGKRTSPSPSREKDVTASSVPSRVKLSLSSRNTSCEDTRVEDASRKVNPLTAMTRETVVRLDKLTNSSSLQSEDNVVYSTSSKDQFISNLGEALLSSNIALKTGQKSDILLRDSTGWHESQTVEDIRSDSKKKCLPSAVQQLVQSCTNVADSSSADICVRSTSSSPSKHPSSILKKKSFDEPHTVIVPATTQPVSILKRKTSQDEASSGSGSNAPTPPVTFSPSVKEQTNSSSRRQGILKKRASLDESEVLRRRSCSPDLHHIVAGENIVDFRPILKHQRRSSLEELVRRTQSPDPQPQSILKRRTSREDDAEERATSSPEPQGILKRKSNVSSSSSSNSTSPHVSIAASVIMTVAGLEGGDFVMDGSEQVRPILKKKSSSEDNTTADSSSAETPRPILKKKSSIEDEMEDKPKKPILKSSRKHSQEDLGNESPTRCLKLRSRSTGTSDSTSGSDCEVVRPILKQHGSDGLRSRERSASPRLRLSFCDDDESAKEKRGDSVISGGSSRGSDDSRHSSPSREGVLLRRHSKSSVSPTARTSSLTMDTEFSGILNKRRSWDTNPRGIDTNPRGIESDSALQLRQSKTHRSERGQRPLSVAERILNMENFLEQEAIRSPPTSPTALTGAVPKRLNLLRGNRDKERFHTQPVTLEELQASARFQSLQSFKKIVIERKASVNGLDDHREKSTSPKHSSNTIEISTKESVSAPVLTNGNMSKNEETMGLSNLYSSTSLCKKDPAYASDSTEAFLPESPRVAEMEDADDLEVGEGRGLVRSNSVSAKASLFAQLEEQMKQAAEEAKSRRLPKGSSNKGIARYRDRKEVWAATRFATQPVTQDEVQEAVRQNQLTGGASTSTHSLVGDQDASKEGNDEDEPSQLSLAERVRLFNQKIIDERLPKTVEALPPPVLRKRLSSRFKTQPVTTEEVETAQKISPLAASLIKPPDPELLATMSARAAREKIYEHGTQILAKSHSGPRLFRVGSKNGSSPRPNIERKASTEHDPKPKGILKNSLDSDSRRASLLDMTASEKEAETESEGEVKGILKTGNTSSSRMHTPELESFRHLKSVLKKESSADDTSHSESYEIVSATNEQLRSILKPESTEWTAEEDTSSTEAGSTSSSDSEHPSRNLRSTGPVKSRLQGGNRIDLVSILHGVEAHARKQRQALVLPPNNKQRLGDEKLRNIKNMSQEKENQLEPAYQKKKVDENHTTVLKKSIETQENHQVFNSKIVEHTSVVNQKKIDSKQVVEEMNQIKRAVETTRVDEKDSNYQRKVRRQLEELQHLSSVDTSDGDTSSSGGREVRRIIRNEAVARRRQAALNKQLREKCHLTGQPPPPHLVKSQSHSSVPTAGGVGAGCDALRSPEDARPGFVKGGLQRSSTQPMTELELGSMSGASIAERLAALKKSGNTDWKKRVPSRLTPDDDLTIITTTNNHINELHSRQNLQNESAEVEVDNSGSSILADRLGKLDAATHGWKKRVGPTDAVKFSVAGKMMLESNTDVMLTPTAAAASPLPAQLQPGDRQKRTPRAARFRSKTAHLKEVSSTPTSPQKETTITFKRSVSAPGGEEENGLTTEEFQGPKVTIPKADDETFTEFFRSVTTSKVQKERVVLCDEDLDRIVSHSNQLRVQKRTVKFQRRNIASRNPIKALAARTDLQEEYVEVKSGVAEKEIRRLKVEQLAKHSSLAVEALAGLASKEDFTAVNLKKASPTASSMLPYKDLMLLHIKGRRHVQTRLVEPGVDSINRGDNYVLVTPTEVFNWVGRYSNVIERSRGAEVAQHIQQRKDLGCSGANQVITISEEKVTCSSSQAERFWRLLGANTELVRTSSPIEAGHPDEDELYEASMIATNMVYEVKDQELVPMDEFWGSIPRISILDPAKILVFDFGSELYVWNGKNASLDDRRLAQRLARELWEEGFDYSECDVCPLNIAISLGGRTDGNQPPLVGTSRPSWALLAKVNQHMETILFREKFLDWPDFSRVIRAKGSDDNEKQMDASIDVKPCDANLMLEPNISEPDLELENTHLGRGQRYLDEETHRHYEITTLGVSVWHIMEYEHMQLPEPSIGQFHAGDSYVVRWQYSITVTGRELGGQPSRHSMLGRDRCAYFCWQGHDASLNEQGAAALLTVELDHERGPQVRVVQGAEPPAFLNLFKGWMVVHAGRREPSEEEEESEDAKGPWKLFLCRGEMENEAVLVQVACSVRQLRSRASLVLLNTSIGVIHVWHGAKASRRTRQITLAAAEQLKTQRPVEVGFKTGVETVLQEHHEGSENKNFFKGLGGGSRQLYVSLADRSMSMDHTPRLFHLSSISGVFSATEILGAYRRSDETVAYPFLQNDLYGASQPALFLLDNQHELWLWQGWWPDMSAGDDTSLNNSNQTGSGAVRWQAERRAAMQTVQDYWRLAHPDSKSSSGLPAYLVWAGLEPLPFTNLFPMWTDRDDIAELNIRDGRKPGEVLTVEDELARLTRSTYPPAQLLQRPLPDGVDPTRLELYLDPHHFQELLGMSKEEFFELPLWKQTNIKKDIGLF